MAYSEKVLDHYDNPRNVGSFDKEAENVGTGMVGAPACGDVMKLQIRVGKNGVIEDARFKTYGCGSAIASSSLVTELIKGKTLNQALRSRTWISSASSHCRLSKFTAQSWPKTRSGQRSRIIKSGVRPGRKDRATMQIHQRRNRKGRLKARSQSLRPLLENRIRLVIKLVIIYTIYTEMAIMLTEEAAQRAQKYLLRRGKGLGIRLGVRTTGCSGLAYTLEYADALAPEDQVFESRGVKIVVDPKSLACLDGTELDFAREGLKEGFKFNNPNAKDPCGCGESFRV